MMVGPKDMRRVAIAAALMTALAIGCSSSDDVTGPVAAGDWGGVGISLIATEQGAQLELDCALGEISQPLVLDAEGGFTLDGTFTPEHGGPVREDEVLESEPATYAGIVDGNQMTLTIHLLNRGTISGPFALERDTTPLLRKCL